MFENWFSQEVEDTGVITGPDGGEMGGHAVCVVGYDDRSKRFKFKNSWGEGWGERGYGYISYDYMEKHSWDAWTSIDMTVPHVPKKVEDPGEKEDLKQIVKEVMRDLLSADKLEPALSPDLPTTEIIIRVEPAEDS